MTLDELFAESHSLPTVPKVVHELIEALRNEDVTVAEVARKINLDQVLSAKMLRHANSPYYGVRRKIVSVEEAIRMLGFSTIRTLVISSGLSGTFKKIPGVDLLGFWAHSLRVASVARHLAGLTEDVDPNVAFTVGSMHAIGHLVMAIAMPHLMEPINTRGSIAAMDRFVVEREALGYSYDQVSARLATQWDFAPELISALGDFVDPMAASEFNPMAAVLHLAVWRVTLEAEGTLRSQLLDSWPEDAATALGITADQISEMPAPRLLAADLEVLIS